MPVEPFRAPLEDANLRNREAIRLVLRDDAELFPLVHFGVGLE